jgi:hypothetical protein
MKLQCLGMALTLAVSMFGIAVTVQAQPASVPYANTLANQRVDLSQLSAHLDAQDWAAADQETRRILQSFVHANGDIFAEPIPTLIPPEVLQAINQLWVEASDGRFGFSVQADIWEELSVGNSTNTQIVAQQFGDRVGWTRTVPHADYIFTSPDWLTKPELNYSLEAPAGHLPWAGVDWSVIEGLLTAQSCGSCTIDVLYLQGDRFSRYLPSLYNWVETALDLPIPQAGTWQQAQLARQIDLRSLYPQSTCPVRETDAAISPDGSLIAISSYSYERSCPTVGESVLAVWDAQHGHRIITLHRGPAVEAFSAGKSPQEPPSEGDRIVGDIANSVAFTPDGQFLAAGMSYGVIRLWSTETWEQAQIYEGHQYAVRAIAFSPNGQTLATADADSSIKLWNASNGSRVITLKGHTELPGELAFSPEGQYLASSDGETARLWNLFDYTTVYTFNLIDTVGHPIQPNNLAHVAFSPDGQTLAASTLLLPIVQSEPIPAPGLTLWDVTTGQPVEQIREVTQFQFSPDGRFLIANGQQVQIWEPYHRLVTTP